MIIERYRADYTGEFVITDTRWVGGKKEQVREWIPNSIENHHLSGRAVCIGSNIYRERFDHTRLQQHRGGLLGSKKIQTYGTGTIAQDMRLDFTVEVNPNGLNEILQRRYQKSNIVYTTARTCMDHPGEFYLIPHNPVLCEEAAIIYLAAFDGHKEIFLLGYNNDMPTSNNAWARHIATIIEAYQLTQFIIVGDKTTVPEKWLSYSNTRCIDRQEFISYCDI